MCVCVYVCMVIGGRYAPVKNPYILLEKVAGWVVDMYWETPKHTLLKHKLSK